MAMKHYIPKIDDKVRGELRIEGRRYVGRTFTVKGREVELYRIGVLAHALDKTSQTVEMWEKDGEFPQPMYKISGQGLGHCRRWYSKEQILNIQNVWRHFPYRKGHKETRQEFFGTIKQVFYQTNVVSLKIRKEPDENRKAQAPPARHVQGPAVQGARTESVAPAADAPGGDAGATRQRVQ